MRLGERHCCHMLPSWKQKALITVNGSPKPPSTSGEWFQAPKIANLHLHSSCTKDHKGLSLLLVPPGLFFSIYNSCFSHVACILHCFVSFCISALCCCILFLYAFRLLGLGWFVWFFFLKVFIFCVFTYLWCPVGYLKSVHWSFRNALTCSAMDSCKARLA